MRASKQRLTDKNRESQPNLSGIGHGGPPPRLFTAIEYGLLASLVALAIIVGATLLGINLGSLFSYIGGKVAPPGS